MTGVICFLFNPAKSPLAFDQIAKYHDFLFMPYYNRVYRKAIKMLLRNKALAENMKVLDIGTATGGFCAKLSKQVRNLDFVGIDQSPAMTRIAQKKFPKAKFAVGVAESLPFPDRSFDLVSIIDALHYVQDQAKAFSEVHRVLKPNGFLFIYTPSIDQFFSKISLLSGKLLSPTENNIKPLKLFEIKKIAQAHGLEPTAQQLINWFPLFFIKNWLLLLTRHF